MLETYADRPMTTQLTVKPDFVHSEIGASADLRMDKVKLSMNNRHLITARLLRRCESSAISGIFLAVAPQTEAQKAQEISFGFCAPLELKMYNCYSFLDQIDCQ